MKPNRNINGRRQQAAERSLSEVLSSLDDAGAIHALLIDLCTPAELQALADRWRVAQLLEEGLPYRAIQDQTGVSVTTVGPVARCLTNGAGGYVAALSTLNPND